MSNAKSLETLVKKGLIDDNKNQTSDHVKGTAVYLSMPLIAVGGADLFMKVGDYTNSHNVPVCVPAIPFVILYLATLMGILPSLACYYFTPPSERAEFSKHHFWVPERLVNYMNRKTAEKCAKTA
jgi:hypothetical protein